ncbi:MAG: glycoside hydrolase family 1 protein [Cetobacterium sp.]
MKKEYKFKKDFFWGSAISALQTEGAHLEMGKGKTTWDIWMEKDPDRFFGGEGNAVAVDFINFYKDDIKMMKEIGHNSFRFSIAWTRLILNPLTGEINDVAVKFYNDLIDELLANKIEPFVCLFHFDMPAAMQDLGGWESKEVLKYFNIYAKKCFELFGDKVKYWFTHNEPIVPIEGCYLYNFHYPFINDFKRGVQAAYNTILSNAIVIRTFKEMKAEGTLKNDREIGIILSLTPSYPRDLNNPEDLKASKICHDFFVRSFLDPCVLGEFNKDLNKLLKDHNLMPEYKEEELLIIKENTVDFLGINYYFPRRVKAKEIKDEKVTGPHSFYDDYEMPGRKFNQDRGWEIFEKGVYDILIDIKNNYGNIKSYISENGMGRHGGDERDTDENGSINDDARIEFVKDHLIMINNAIEEGSNCVGYHMWSLMDNWSMSNAFKNRYGFLFVDRENGLKRKIKKSGYWMAEVAKNNKIVEVE